MTSSNIPPPYDVGLHGDAALRYALVQMVVASPHCMPNSYMQTATALYEYIKADELAAKRFDAATTGWVDGDKVRFVDGIPESVDGRPVDD